MMRSSAPAVAVAAEVSATATPTAPDDDDGAGMPAAVTALTTLIAVASVDGNSTSCDVSSSELVSDSARATSGDATTDSRALVVSFCTAIAPSTL
jgi:hypothetical protein